MWENIHHFNKFGIDSIIPKKVGKKSINQKVEDEIVRIVLTKPEN